MLVKDLRNFQTIQYKYSIDFFQLFQEKLETLLSVLDKLIFLSIEIGVKKGYANSDKCIFGFKV